jgi:hypothetical protein
VTYSNPESTSETMNHSNIIFIGFLRQGIGLFQGLYLYTTTLKIDMINNDANEIRTRDATVGKVEGCTDVSGTGFK